MVKSDTALRGMSEICAYVGLSAPTVLKYIREREFPAKLTKKGGVWISDKDLVDGWRREWISGNTERS